MRSGRVQWVTCRRAARGQGLQCLMLGKSGPLYWRSWAIMYPLWCLTVCLPQPQANMGCQPHLVEQQDARLAEDGARDGYALPLAAGQAHALLADRRVVALREARDEVVRVRYPRRLFNLRGSVIARMSAAS